MGERSQKEIQEDEALKSKIYNDKTKKHSHINMNESRVLDNHDYPWLSS